MSITEHRPDGVLVPEKDPAGVPPMHSIVKDPVRKADFFDLFRDPVEADMALRCRECGFSFGHIPEDWIEAHVGEHVPCPNCMLPSRIPTREEANSDHNVPGSGVPRAVDGYPAERG